jgi:hypothetical protein
MLVPIFISDLPHSTVFTLLSGLSMTILAAPNMASGGGSPLF